jgi:hypothetical protein
MNFKFKIGTIWDTFSNADALSKLAEENLSLKSDCPKIFALKGKDLHLGGFLPGYPFSAMILLLFACSHDMPAEVSSGPRR